VDSVVLCDLCKKAGYDFVIAHCNFQLRSAESDADELFVKELAAKYSVDFYTRKFDTEKYAAEYKLSIQVAARNLRYDWFSQLIAEHTSKPINYLLTAHHANDNIETVLMNFFKGTGMAGLQGIQPKSGQGNHVDKAFAVCEEKKNLLQYAEENDLPFPGRLIQQQRQIHTKLFPQQTNTIFAGSISECGG
jgi:tRNA(Ile)-lysidine synthase